MKRLIWLSALLIFSRFAFGLEAAALEEVGLTNGKRVSGSLKILKDGVFHASAAGGKLYRWPEIEPASLPAKVREAQRQRVLKDLRRAQKYYEQEKLLEAQMLFQRTYRHRRYLSDEDRQRPEFRDITFKQQGYVQFEGQWLLFSAKQKKLGLEFYQGKWRPAAEVIEEKAFRAALWQARESRDPVKCIVKLQKLLDKYPRSRFRKQAAELIVRLREWSAQPRTPRTHFQPLEPEPEEPAPQLDDYYTSYQVKLDKPGEVEKPDLQTYTYVDDDDDESRYPYGVPDRSTGYYAVPRKDQLKRGKDGYYEYNIGGIRIRTKTPLKIKIKP